MLTVGQDERAGLEGPVPGSLLPHGRAGQSRARSAHSCAVCMVDNKNVRLGDSGYEKQHRSQLVKLIEDDTTVAHPDHSSIHQ